MTLESATLTRASEPRVRQLLPPDEPLVRAVFRRTLALGRPLPFPLPGLVHYERLCIGWFFQQAWSQAAVLDDGQQVCGYALVCTDEAAFRRWLAPVTAGWLASVLAALASGRLPAKAAEFYRCRLRDGLQALRRTAAPPMPAHAHVNLDRGVRAGRAGLALLDHVDQQCRRAGLPGWYAEINARRGRRAAALRAGGFEVVRRAPSHTLSWLVGEPVERLTVVRALARPATPGAFRRGRAPVAP